MSEGIERRDGLVVDYLRSRGRVDVPPDLVLSVVDAAHTQPQQRATWFGAFLPAVAAVASIALIVIVATLVSKPPSTGPAPAPSSSGSSERQTASPEASASQTAPARPTSSRVPAPTQVGLLTVESEARSSTESCTTQGEFTVKLVAKRADSVVSSIDVVEDGTHEFPEGFPRVVWPAGFSADLGSRVTIMSGDGTVVVTEGQPFALAGGSVDQDGYHVCLIDGKRYPRRAEEAQPMLQVAVHETNDSVSDVTFYLGYSDGTTVYSETFTRDQLENSGWFGPFDGHFLRVSFEGGRSTVSELTLTGGTPRRVYTADGAFLAATMSPDGEWIYVSRSDADLKEDVGIWRIGADGGEAVRILAPDADRPASPGQRGSLLTWTPDGNLLVVQHCRGDSGDDCTWSLVEGETGEVVRDVVPDQPAGLMVGIANDRLLAGRNCNGLSCTSNLVAFANGRLTSADGSGQRETLVESEVGPILLHDSGASYGSYRVTATELDTGREWTAYETGGPGRMLVTLERPFGGVQLEPGWFALAEEGQFGTQHFAPPLLVNAVDQRQVELVNLGD